MPDFLTRPKPGAPTELDIVPSQWETWLGPLGLAYTAPLFGLVRDTPILTADLCASPPPPEERWTVNDVIASLMPATQAIMTEKLNRMAYAALWPTYCEYYPAPTPTGGAFDGTPIFLAHDGFGEITQNSNPPTFTTVGSSARTVTSGPMTENVWFWTLWRKCTVQPTDNNGPQLHHFGYDDTNVSNAPDGTWPINLGVESWALILPENLSLELGTQPPRWGMTAGQSGTWIWQLTAWGRAVPPTPEPWAPAPVVPDTFQFSDECVIALCEMADQWPAHKLSQELTYGAVIEVDLELELAKQEILAAIAAGGGGTGIGFQEAEGGGLVDGSSEWPVPGDVVGFFCEILQAENAVVIGTSPEAYLDVGWVTEGWGDHWYPSEPIRHSPQLFYPLQPQTTKIGFNLKPGVMMRYTWLIAT